MPRLFGVSDLILLSSLDDALQLFGSLGPCEGTTVGVVRGNELLNKIFEILFGSLNAMCQALFAQNTEEAFDQIHPGSMGGSVMERDEFVAFQPPVGGLVLMNVEIIRHDMKLLLRIGAHDVIHEAEKVYGTSWVTDMGYDLAR